MSAPFLFLASLTLHADPARADALVVELAFLLLNFEPIAKA